MYIIVQFITLLKEKVGIGYNKIRDKINEKLLYKIIEGL